MKKTGFTLAEVLITLLIIGVVASITLPALRNDTSTAQVGPKLTKAVSVFEQANEMLLNDKSANSVSGLTDDLKTIAYVNFLKKYLKFGVREETGKTVILMPDGVEITLPEKFDNTDTASDSYNRRIDAASGDGEVMIDINGSGGANKDAKDLFYFAMYDDGSLRPQGSVDWDKSAESKFEGKRHWKNEKTCIGGAVPQQPKYCAGSIFENDRKVKYK